MPRKSQERKLVRANLRLDAEVYQRLLVHAVMENRSAGDIVSRLLTAHLRGWSMPGKVTARSMSTVSAKPDVHVESPAEIAA